MSKELTIKAEDTPVLSESKLIEWLDICGMATQLDEKEKRQYLEMCRAHGLNPYIHEIHVSKRQGKLCLMTGYVVYIKRAERTGLLNGWKSWVEEMLPNMKAYLKIWRKDWAQPFEYDVIYEECVQRKDSKPNYIWAKQPGFMLKKVCISQGFRLCFPQQLGGLPYEEAEQPIAKAEVQETLAPVREKDTAFNIVMENTAQVLGDELEELLTIHDSLLPIEDTAKIRKALPGLVKEGNVERLQRGIDWVKKTVIESQDNPDDKADEAIKAEQVPESIADQQEMEWEA